MRGATGLERGRRTARAIGLLVAAGLAIAAGTAAGAAESGDEGDDSTLIPFPFLYYTPETKTAFGATVAYYFQTSRDTTRNWPSSISPVVIYTQRKQFITAAAADVYLDEGRYHLLAGLSYVRFPDTFWGVGNDAPDAAEEDFTARTFGISALAQQRVAPGWYVGGTVAAARRELVETEPGGLLDRRAIPGTADGWVVGIGAQANRDTRDSTVFPTRGGILQLGAAVHDGALGSDYDFASFNLDVRAYRPLGARRALAVRALGLAVTREPPFDLLPALGGDALLRGYYAGRFRDRNLIACQVEYRAPLWRRLGWTAFLSAGQVAREPGELAADGFHPAGGLGLRFLLSAREGLNLRADFGFGDGDSGFYLGMGEVF